MEELREKLVVRHPDDATDPGDYAANPVVRTRVRDDGHWCHVLMSRVLVRKSTDSWVRAMGLGLAQTFSRRDLTLEDRGHCTVTALMVVMLGGDADCAIVPAITLTGFPNASVSDKRLGYLFCSLAIPPGDPRLLLLANQIRKDLASGDPLVVLAALTASARLVCEEAFTALIQAIWGLASHRHPMVRRRSLIALLGFLKGPAGKHTLSIAFKKPAEVFVSTLQSATSTSYLASLALCRALAEISTVKVPLFDRSSLSKASLLERRDSAEAASTTHPDGDITVVSPGDLDAMISKTLDVSEELLQHHGAFSEASKPTVFMQIETVRLIGSVCRAAPAGLLNRHLPRVLTILGGVVRRARGKILPAAFSLPASAFPEAPAGWGAGGSSSSGGGGSGGGGNPNSPSTPAPIASPRAWLFGGGKRSSVSSSASAPISASAPASAAAGSRCSPPPQANSPASGGGIRFSDIREKARGAFSWVGGGGSSTGGSVLPDGEPSPEDSRAGFAPLAESAGGGGGGGVSHQTHRNATGGGMEAFGGGPPASASPSFLSGILASLTGGGGGGGGGGGTASGLAPAGSPLKAPTRSDMEGVAVIQQVLKTLTTGHPAFLAALRGARQRQRDSSPPPSAAAASGVAGGGASSPRQFIKRVVSSALPSASPSVSGNPSDQAALSILKTCGEVVGFLQPFIPAEPDAGIDEAVRAERGVANSAGNLGFANACRARGDALYAAMRLVAFLSLVDQSEGVSRKGLVMRALCDPDPTLFLTGVDAMCSLARADNIHPITHTLLRYAERPPPAIKNFATRASLRPAVASRLLIVSWDIARVVSPPLFLRTSLSVMRRFGGTVSSAAHSSSSFTSTPDPASAHRAGFFGWLHDALALTEGESVFGHFDLELACEDDDDENDGGCGGGNANGGSCDSGSPCEAPVVCSPAAEARQARITQRHAFRDQVCDSMTAVLCAGASSAGRRLVSRDAWPSDSLSASSAGGSPCDALSSAARPAAWVLGEFSPCHGSASLGASFDTLLDFLQSPAAAGDPAASASALLSTTKLLITYTHLRLSGQPVSLPGSAARPSALRNTSLRHEALAAYAACLERLASSRNLAVSGAAQMAHGIARISAQAMDAVVREGGPRHDTHPAAGGGVGEKAELFEALSLPFATSVQPEVDESLGFLDGFVAEAAAERAALGFEIRPYVTHADRRAKEEEARLEELQKEMLAAAAASTAALPPASASLPLALPSVPGPWGRGGYQSLDATIPSGIEAVGGGGGAADTTSSQGPPVEQGGVLARGGADGGKVVAKAQAQAKSKRRRKEYAWLAQAMETMEKGGGGGGVEEGAEEVVEQQQQQGVEAASGGGMQGEGLETYWGREAQPKLHIWGKPKESATRDPFAAPAGADTDATPHGFPDTAGPDDEGSRPLLG